MKFLLFFICLAHADPHATVWSREPDAVRKFFPPEQYLMLDSAAEAKELEDQGYVQPRERAALFHKLQIEEALENLDDLDKDILVMGARFEPLETLKKHFPML